jgi:serine/threonine protein kinase
LARTSLRESDPARIGRYRLTARLGSGGMGVVYLGVAPDGGEVAVKVLRPELADEPEFRRRFGREVSVLTRVRGVCTVRVIEADTESARPFMVTEYADGPSLAEYIDSYGPLSADLLYGLATGLAEALTVIHAAGIVHRDLKPSNVILTAAGPKVIDFGIAQTLDTTSVTKTGMMVGSAGFMAPEQISGRPGPAADIFVWGITVGYAAAGQSPFGTGDTNAILYRVLYADPDITAVPEPLKPLVEAALAKDPQSRPAARELLDRLTRAAIGPEPVRQRPADSATQTVLAQTWQQTGPRDVLPSSDRLPAGASRPQASQWWLAAPPQLEVPPQAHSGSLLLEPAPAGSGPVRRVSRRAKISASAIGLLLVAGGVLAAVAVPGHSQKAGPLAGNDSSPQAASAVALPGYAGQQRRGVFQQISRIVSAGDTMVTTGSQSAQNGTVTRQQFFVSSDGGDSWRLAPVHAPGGGQAPLGYSASRIAGGAHGWLAIGPDATWTSPDGLSWTLAAAHGISPAGSGDSADVISNTAGGFLAGGHEQTGSGQQAVIWTSRDGLAWQRRTASQLGLTTSGQPAGNIAYATTQGNNTLISDDTSVWLSTDGGSAWTQVTVPVDHGAGNNVSGVSFDGSGLLVVRPGRTAGGASDGIAYFSPNGLTWQYAGTLDAAGGFSPAVVKGSKYGFVVTGQAAGQQVAYTSTGTGGTWLRTGGLGDSSAGTGLTATVGPGGNVFAVGSQTKTKTGQQAVFVEANTAGNVSPVLTLVAGGGVVPQIAVNSSATAAAEQIAVGSADGYPAVWRQAAGGPWSLVTSLSQVSGITGLAALTNVTHGPAGWLAVGTPGPVILTSADGISWQPARGAIAQYLAGVASIAAAAGPDGYLIVGSLVEPNGGSLPEAWWSRNLVSWTKGHEVNETGGSSQVLAVAAANHSFVSAGSRNGRPVVWVTIDGLAWKTVSLPLAAGASAGVMTQVAIDGSHVVATGQQTTSAGPALLVDMSGDGGYTWHTEPFAVPGQVTTITALTGGTGGFVAATQIRPAGGAADAAVWTSPGGASWTQSPVSGLAGGGSHDITALVRSGPDVTAIETFQTQATQKFIVLPLTAR